jgi:hypothetical protein
LRITNKQEVLEYLDAHNDATVFVVSIIELSGNSWILMIYHKLIFLGIVELIVETE